LFRELAGAVVCAAVSGSANREVERLWHARIVWFRVAPVDRLHAQVIRRGVERRQPLPFGGCCSLLRGGQKIGAIRGHIERIMFLFGGIICGSRFAEGAPPVIAVVVDFTERLAAIETGTGQGSNARGLQN